jgi:hypothetical protein
MVYRKGERKIDHTACGWPHQVWVPWTRSDAERQAFEDFCRGMGKCDCQSLRSRSHMAFWVRCFAERTDAQCGADQFGGEYGPALFDAPLRSATTHLDRIDD